MDSPVRKVKSREEPQREPVLMLIKGDNFDPYQAALNEMSKNNADVDKALAWLQQAIADGNPNAAYALGTWYLHGVHQKQNLREALKLLRQAALKNVPEALYDLAVCYEQGTGTKQNFRLAMESYLKAALSGDKQSFYEVGRCYYYGIGTERNLRLASIWFKQAKRLGIHE
jgi:TPR repeat protein